MAKPKKIDATAWALWVSNDMEYGEHLNGEIVTEWGDKECKAFCQDYIDNIIASNGSQGSLTGMERQMIRELNLITEEV